MEVQIIMKSCGCHDSQMREETAKVFNKNLSSCIVKIDTSMDFRNRKVRGISFAPSWKLHNTLGPAFRIYVCDSPGTFKQRMWLIQDLSIYGMGHLMRSNNLSYFWPISFWTHGLQGCPSSALNAQHGYLFGITIH